MRRIIAITTIAVLGLILVASAGLAAEPSVKVPYFTAAPQLDGKLDDASWQVAAEAGGTLTLDYHLYGQEASVDKTSEVFLGWDNDYLYIAYKNYQDADTVVATVTDDGGYTWQSDDDVEIFISTEYPGVRPWLQLISNPNAIRTTFGLSSDNSAWEAAAQVHDEYWVVEIAVPFEVFAVWPEAGDTWSGNFSRHWMPGTSSKWLTWSPLVQDTFLDETSFGKLEFVK